MTLAAQLLICLHILCMIGAFGGLLAFQAALPASLRANEDAAAGLSRVVNILIGIGLLAGALRYGIAQGHTLGAHYNGVIGAKFVILLAVGALVGMSKKPGRGNLFRTVSIILLAIAALLGSTIWY